MNRQLVLLRHAKSSWETVGLADHDRPLAPRGRRAVAALRRHLAGACIAPDLVLCSTARRAVETWEGIAPAFPSGTSVELADELYGATAGELLRRLRQLPATVACVLMVGHSPGLADLATGLAGSGAADLLRRLQTKFPTGALATLVVPGPWANLRWGHTELAGYVVPRELSRPKASWADPMSADPLTHRSARAARNITIHGHHCPLPPGS
jgi:phosphohistidine phosphatase